MADLIQWVNLDPANADLRNVPGEGTIPPERCGPTIRLRARVNGRRRAGKPVYWGVQLGAENLAPMDAANAGWSHHADMGGFSAPGYYEKLVHSDRQGYSSTEFRLSQVGGDEYTIKAYTKRRDGSIKKELKSDKITIWRQLYYQRTTMGASTGPQALPAVPDINWAGLRAEYDDSRKRHHMRWTEAGTAALTRQLSLWNDDLTKAVGLESYDRAREPLCLKVSLIDMMAEKLQEDHTFDVVRNQRTYSHTFSRLLFDLDSADDKADWFISASANRRGDTSAAVTVTRNDFTKTGPASVSVALNTVPTCRRATVRVSVNTYSGGTLGLSWYNGIWAIHRLPTRRNRAPVMLTMAADEKVATMVHEFGHAIGMVPRNQGHPHQYDSSHGHQGSHCWNGATDPATFPAADPYTSPTGAVCGMFGDSSSNTERFCDECSDFVRSRRPSVHGKFRAASMMPADIATW